MLPRLAVAAAAAADAAIMTMNSSWPLGASSAGVVAASGPRVAAEPSPPPRLPSPLPIDVLALEPFAAPKDSMQMFLDELRLSINATAQDGEDLGQLVDLVRLLRFYYRPFLIVTG